MSTFPNGIKRIASAFATCAAFILVLAGCAHVPARGVPETYGTPAPEAVREPPDQAPPLPAPSPLVLTFAGDIMAHRCNYSMARYESIYDDVRDYLRADDLTFGNLEMPVDDSLPESTYPRFNVHSPYLAAAVEGGFDVFSLANNHANDQGALSMQATKKAVENQSGVALSSGLKSFPGEGMKAVMAAVKGQDILFLAVTEILNSYDSSRNLVYLVPPRETERAAFLETVRAMRAANPESLFVLSIHVNESEYGRTVSESKKAWFSRLAEAGADIIWAHHPHVMQSWQILTARDRSVLVMYSMGNFISGQRWDTDRENPDGYREYTGDAVLLRVTAAPNGPLPSASGFSFSVAEYPVTNWRDRREGLVVRRVTESFMNGLSPAETEYYRERWRLMQAYLPVAIPAD